MKSPFIWVCQEAAPGLEVPPLKLAFFGPVMLGKGSRLDPSHFKQVSFLEGDVGEKVQQGAMCDHPSPGWPCLALSEPTGLSGMLPWPSIQT